MANVPLSEDVPKIYVPSLSVPKLKVPQITAPQIKVPGPSTVRYTPKPKRYLHDVGDLLLGDPLLGTKQLQNSLAREHLYPVAAIPILNRIAGAGAMLKERAIEPLLEGDTGTFLINTLESFGDSLDLLSNPVKSTMPWAGGGTPEDFLKSMGWLDDEYREMYQWDTGNFIVDLIGETVSDPFNWFSFGGKQLTKEGIELSEDLIRKLLKKVLKTEDIPEAMVKKYTVLLSEKLTDDEFARRLADALNKERSILLDEVKTMPKYSEDVLNTKQLIKNYDKVLSPKVQNEINQYISDIRNAKWYKRYVNINKVTNDVADMERKLTQAAYILAPGIGLAHLVGECLMSKTFKPLWNKYVINRKPLDIKSVLNDTAGVIEKDGKEIIQRSKTINKDLFEAFDEMLAKYNINTERLIEIYERLIKDTPTFKLNKRYLDDEFRKYMFKIMPELESYYYSKEYHKEVKEFLEQFRPKDLDAYIEKIRETAVVKQANAKRINNFKKEITELRKFNFTNFKNNPKALYNYVKTLVEEAENSGLDITDFRKFKNKVYATVRDYIKEHNIDTSYDAIKKLVQIKINRFQYLGINYKNASTVMKLLANPTEENINKLYKVLKKGYYENIKPISETASYLKKVTEKISPTKIPSHIPTNSDDEELKAILSYIEGSVEDDKKFQKKLQRMVETANSITNELEFDSFKKELNDMLDLIDLENLDRMPIYTDIDPDLDISNTTFFKAILERKYDLTSIKDIRDLNSAITDLKHKSVYWYNQLKDNKFKENLTPEMKDFIIKLYSFMRSTKAKKIVIATEKLAQTGNNFVKFMVSQQGMYSMLRQNLELFLLDENNRRFYNKVIDYNSNFRNNLSKLIATLSEEGMPEEAKQVANSLNHVLCYIDAFQSLTILMDKEYTYLDIPKKCKQSIYGEIVNYLYKNKNMYIYQIPDSKEIAEEIVNKYLENNYYDLYDYFKENHINVRIAESEELKALENKLNTGLITDEEYARYEELKSLEDIKNMQEPNIREMVDSFTEDLKEEIKTTFDAYVEHLIECSVYDDYEFKLYTMLSDESVNYMNDLGMSFSRSLELFDDPDIKMKIQNPAVTDFIEFVNAVAGQTLQVDDLLKKELVTKNENSLAFNITNAFRAIDKKNDELANVAGNLGKDLNGKKIKNILNYVSMTELSDAIDDVTVYHNVYDFSTANGFLAVRYEIRKDTVDTLNLSPKLINARNEEYTKLYRDLDIAYNRAKSFGVYKKENVEKYRDWLIRLFKNNNIGWGPKEPITYFENATDLQILAWDGMLRSKCFSKSAARKYRMIRQIDLTRGYNLKADYYSNPWKIYQGIDSIGEEIFSDDDAYDKVIRLIETDQVVSNAFFDELYRGVTADLRQTIKDKETLLRYEFLFTTQIQEQTKAINELRELDNLHLNTMTVGDVLKKYSKKDRANFLKILKSYGIYEDTLLGHESVQKFIYRERKQALSNSVAQFNAKQLRTFIDRNSEGFIFWVTDIDNPLPAHWTDKKLKAAGLHCTRLVYPISFMENTDIYIIRRTNNKMTNNDYVYKIGTSLFPNMQKAVTTIFKNNRHHFYWDGMDIPNEVYTGDMMNKSTYDTIKKDKQVSKALGSMNKQKTYSKLDKEGNSTFFTSEISRPNVVFLGAPNAMQVVLDATDPTFKKFGVTAHYPTNNLIKSVWSGNISAVKRENKINKYLQLWLNNDYSLGNSTFRPILENATDDELKELLNSNRYSVAIVRQDSKGRPRVYRIHVENQKQLQDAIKAQAIIVPQEIYRNMVLAVNKHKMENNAMRFYKNIIAATYKTIYLRTPGFLLRNFLDSDIIKNASTDGGIEGIIDNFKYEFKAQRLLEWHNQVQFEMLHLFPDDTILSDGSHNAVIKLDKAIESLNRKQIRYGLKHLTTEEARATYYLIDMFLSSSASGGLSKALEKYLLDYSLEHGKFNGSAFEKWYGENVLGSIAFKPFQDVNDTIEQTGRLGLFLKLIDEGGDYTEAIRKVVSTHFDYSMKESGISALDDIFWFSTFPINNFMYYINIGLTENPNVLKLQMDAMQLSWNDNDITWDDLRESKYLRSYALSGHLRFKWIDGHHVIVKTGSSVFDFLGLLLNPIESIKGRVNPFLSVLLGFESPSSLNPFAGDLSRLKQIQKRFTSPLGSFIPSVYTKFDINKHATRHYIEHEPYVKRRIKPHWGYVKSKKSYFKKPDNMKRMKYAFTTYRYYFNRGKNMHRWLNATNSIEPYWYMNKRRYMRTNKMDKYIKQVVHVE